MDSRRALTYVRTDDYKALTEAIQAINATRRQPFGYDRVLLSPASQGWVALQLGSEGVSDHLLLRNLSGELGTLAFELALDLVGLNYRLHQHGRTISAHESNLAFCISHRLHMLQSAEDVVRLDLAEAVDRYVLRLFHERLHASPLSADEDDVPDRLVQEYGGSITALRPVLRPGTQAAYANGLLSPGVNPENAFWRLVGLLDLPYLPTPNQPASFTTGRVVTVRGNALRLAAADTDDSRLSWQQAAAMFVARPAFR